MRLNLAAFSRPAESLNLHRNLDKPAKIGVAAACAFLVAVGAVIFGLNAPLRPRIVVPQLNGYQYQVTRPNCSLYFTEGTKTDYTGPRIYKIRPIHSKIGIIIHFSHNPLKGLWIPDHLKSCYSPFGIKNYDYNYDSMIYYSKGRFSYINCDYRTNPKDIFSKSIGITLSYGKPCFNIFNQGETEKQSRIYHTTLFVIHYPPEGTGPGSFSAEFSYRGVGYTVSSENGVTQTEFINVLTSIIRS